MKIVTTGHCVERAKPSGCQLHNIQCGYPKCDVREVEAPANAVRSEPQEIDRLRARVKFLEDASRKSNDEICQILGKALGYPWFKDDQDLFPGATERDGVCVGDHVAETLAMEAATRITGAPSPNNARWVSIDTAPRDGTRIIARGDLMIDQEIYWNFRWRTVIGDHICTPSQWLAKH